jgi:hypothetical protein
VVFAEANRWFGLNRGTFFIVLFTGLTVLGLAVGIMIQWSNHRLDLATSGTKRAVMLRNVRSKWRSPSPWIIPRGTAPDSLRGVAIYALNRSAAVQVLMLEDSEILAGPFWNRSRCKAFRPVAQIVGPSKPEIFTFVLLSPPPYKASWPATIRVKLMLSGNGGERFRFNEKVQLREIGQNFTEWDPSQEAGIRRRL